MNKFFIKYFPKIVFFVILVLLVLHMFGLDFIIIDNTTILLVILLLLTPFTSSLKKIKWGEFEAEIDPQEVKKVQKEIEKIPKSKGEEKKPLFYVIGNISDEIYSVLETDHILALAKLRIELEKILNKILVSKKKDKVKKLGIGHVVRILEKEGIIDKPLINVIRKVISFCNRAIHGEEVQKEDAYRIVNMGLDLLDNLSSFYFMTLIKPFKKIKLTEEQMKKYYDAKYEVTTLIPIVGEPYMNKRILTQEGLDQLLEGYGEYAEFLVEIKKLDRKK